LNKKGGCLFLADIKAPKNDTWGTGLDLLQKYDFFLFKFLLLSFKYLLNLVLENEVNQSLLDLHALDAMELDAKQS